MATIEQYGFGPYGVRIVSERDDFVGTYRFCTLEEAKAFRAKNGGRLFHSRTPLATLAELGQARAAAK